MKRLLRKQHLRYISKLEPFDFDGADRTLTNRDTAQFHVENDFFFQSAFYTRFPPPPLGAFDPCFQKWAETVLFAYMLQLIPSAFSPASTIYRTVLEQYFQASREYADALLRCWGAFLPSQVKTLWEIDGPIPNGANKGIISQQPR
jgi:S-adenosylmethionine:diacylglycerol 3-amino-3-carboxypropyl transferase